MRIRCAIKIAVGQSSSAALEPEICSALQEEGKACVWDGVLSHESLLSRDVYNKYQR